MFKLTLVENVETSQIEIQNMKEKILEEDEKDLINNIII